MVKKISKKIMNSFFKKNNNIVIFHRCLKNNNIFYYGKSSDNFILFNIYLKDLNLISRLKYYYFLNYFILFRFLKRIGFLKFLAKFSNNVLFKILKY